MKSDRVFLDSMIRFDVCIKYSISYRCSLNYFKPLVKIKRPVKITAFANTITEEIRANPEKMDSFNESDVKQHKIHVCYSMFVII